MIKTIISIPKPREYRKMTQSDIIRMYNGFLKVLEDNIAHIQSVQYVPAKTIEYLISQLTAFRQKNVDILGPDELYSFFKEEVLPFQYYLLELSGKVERNSGFQESIVKQSESVKALLPALRRIDDPDVYEYANWLDTQLDDMALLQWQVIDQRQYDCVSSWLRQAETDIREILDDYAEEERQEALRREGTLDDIIQRQYDAKSQEQTTNTDKIKSGIEMMKKLQTLRKNVSVSASD